MSSQVQFLHLPTEKSKNLDIRNGLIMMASVLTFTVVGSYIASLVPSTTMGGFSVFMTFLLGIKFDCKAGYDDQRSHAGRFRPKNEPFSLLSVVSLSVLSADLSVQAAA